MSFVINLYQNNSSPNTLIKSLTEVSSVSGNIKEKTSIVDPVILFQFDTVPSFNYVYIPVFGRYYFVKNITNYKNNLWEITMHVDVLMSYQRKILSCPCVCSRQENLGNMYIQDSQLPISNKTFTTTQQIGTSYFSNNAYILICQ